VFKQWFTLHGKFRFRRKVSVVLLAGAMLASVTMGYAPPNASWYALFGATTACGDVVTAEDWTAAHKTLPCGQKITVCGDLGCARGVVITDRGPYVWGRDLDLNLPVADRIGLTDDGADYVQWWTTGYDPNYAYK
jgi:rare lipoprotein A (peptidoglycan hydrolase)